MPPQRKAGSAGNGFLSGPKYPVESGRAGDLSAGLEVLRRAGGLNFIFKDLRICYTYFLRLTCLAHIWENVGASRERKIEDVREQLGKILSSTGVGMERSESDWLSWFMSALAIV